MHNFASAVMAALIATWAAPAFAADPSANEGFTPVFDAGTNAVSYPNISVEGSIELQAQTIRPSTEPDGRIKEAFVTVEPEISVNLSEQFALVAHLLFEPVKDPEPGSTSWFSHQGLYAEELYARASFDDLELKGGKLDPAFGLATDLAPGVYGPDIAQSYDYKGALGGSVRWLFASTPTTDYAGGEARRYQSVNLTLFSADTTFLSRSLFTDRGQLSLDDGGVGNSGRPESFALAYNIATVNSDDAIVGPTAQVAVRRLAKGTDDNHDEWGIVGSGTDVFQLTDGVTLTALAEAAYFVHQAGGDADSSSGTLSGELREGAWVESVTLAAVRTLGEEGFTDSLVTASVGRDFELGADQVVRVDAAYARSRTEGDNADTFGLRLHKDFSWSSKETPQLAD